MKIILSESQVENLIGLLTEVETAQFEIIKQTPETTKYSFNVNGYDYYVDIDTEEDELYYISFSYSNKDDNDLESSVKNSKLDIKHLNSVLYTVGEIVEDFVSTHPDINIITMRAIYDTSRGEDEDTLYNIRTRVYERFIKMANFNYVDYQIDEISNVIDIFFK